MAKLTEEQISEIAHDVYHRLPDDLKKVAAIGTEDNSEIIQPPMTTQDVISIMTGIYNKGQSFTVAQYKLLIPVAKQVLLWCIDFEKGMRVIAAKQQRIEAATPNGKTAMYIPPSKR